MTNGGLKGFVGQLSKFSLIGICNGALDLVALNLMLRLYPGDTTLELALANSIAYALAVLNSYYWNSRIAFRNESSHSANEKFKFFAQAAASLLISNAVFVLATRMIGQFDVPLWVVHNASKGLSMLLSSTCSFLFLRYLVFKPRRSSSHPLRMQKEPKG